MLRCQHAAADKDDAQSVKWAAQEVQGTWRAMVLVHKGVRKWGTLLLDECSAAAQSLQPGTQLLMIKAVRFHHYLQMSAASVVPVYLATVQAVVHGSS